MAKAIYILLGSETKSSKPVPIYIGHGKGDAVAAIANAPENLREFTLGTFGFVRKVKRAEAGKVGALVSIEIPDSNQAAKALRAAIDKIEELQSELAKLREEKAAPSQHSNPPTADREGNSPAASGETPVPPPQATNTNNEQGSPQGTLLTPEGEQSPSGDSGGDADVPRLPKAKKP